MLPDILIADDESPKLVRLQDFVTQLLPNSNVRTSRSVRTTIAAMREQCPDILLLDMSLPTFDIAQGEPGGRPQGSGGSEVLRHMEFYGIQCPVVIVTQYESFKDNGKLVDLAVISLRLQRDHAQTFRGCVYYSSLNDDWKPLLASFVNSELFRGVE